MENDKNTELQNLGFVRTVLIILVVFYHCILFWCGSWFTADPVFSSKIFPVLSQWLNSFHIYGLTLVSGYLFFFLKYEARKYHSFSSFFDNKCRRLLIPYVFVLLIWVIPFALEFFDYEFIEIVKNFIIGMSPNQLWFLLMLFGVFIIFYPLSDFFKNFNVLGSITVVILYGAGLVGLMLHLNVLQIFRACSFIPFFLLGFKIRQYGSYYLKKIHTLIWLFVDIFLFAITALLSSFDGIIFSLLYRGFIFLLNIVGALMAFVILQKIACKIKWNESRFFSFLSKNTMPIFLFHQQIIYIFLQLLNGVVSPGIHAAINFAGTMMVSVLISSVFMKFKFTRMLIGEK